MNQAPPTRRERLLTQVVQRAVFSPPSLGLLTAALVFATHPSTWLPGAALAILNCGYLFLRVRSPEYIRRVSEELYRDRWREQIARAEELQRSLDRGTASLLGSLIGSQERLLALAEEGAGIVPSRNQAAELLAHCLQLAQKRVNLQHFLAETRATDLEREAQRLQRQAEGSPDPVARGLYQQAVEQKRAEIDNLKAIEQAIARIDGQLEAVDATFDNLVGKIMRLRSAESPEDTLEQQQVRAELEHLSHGVAALEATLNETVTVGGG